MPSNTDTIRESDDWAKGQELKEAGWINLEDRGEYGSTQGCDWQWNTNTGELRNRFTGEIRTHEYKLIAESAFDPDLSKLRQVLEKLKLATIRLEIANARMRGCNEILIEWEKEPIHGLIPEVESWIREQREYIGTIKLP